MNQIKIKQKRVCLIFVLDSLQGTPRETSNSYNTKLSSCITDLKNRVDNIDIGLIYFQNRKLIATQPAPIIDFQLPFLNLLLEEPILTESEFSDLIEIANTYAERQSEYYKRNNVKSLKPIIVALTEKRLNIFDFLNVRLKASFHIIPGYNVHYGLFSWVTEAIDIRSHVVYSTTAARSQGGEKFDLKTKYPRNVKDLSKGGVRLLVNNEMFVGISQKVSISISFNKLSLMLDELGVVEDIYLTRKMKAVLIADDKFEITPMSSEVQLVLDEDTTMWNWTLKPLKVGAGNIEIILSAAIVTKDYGTDMKDIESFHKNIKININPKYTARKFLETNWQWILSMGGAAGLILAAMKIFGFIK